MILIAPASKAEAQDNAALFARVGRLLQSRCALPGCHVGPDAAEGMRLEASRIYRSTVNVRSRSDRRFLRVMPGAPEQSLLYLKLLPAHDGHYRGDRMPLGMDALSEADLALVRQWIDSFSEDLWGEADSPESITAAPRVFQDSHLHNLPTPDPLGAGVFEFRILHRFKASVSASGGSGLYGLDSGAWISLGLAYGLARNLELGVRRTSLQTDYEAYLKGGPR